MKKSVKIFNMFIGGMSEDESLPREHTFLYSENINISNANYVSLSQRPVNLFETSRKIVGCVENGSRIIVKDSLISATDEDIDIISRDSGEIIHTLQGKRVYSCYSTGGITGIIGDFGGKIIKYMSEPAYDTNFNPNGMSVISQIDPQYYFVAGKQNNTIYKARSYDNGSSTTFYYIADYNFSIGKIIAILSIPGGYLVFDSKQNMYEWDGKEHNYQKRVKLGMSIDYAYQIGSNIFIISEGGMYQLNGYSLVKIMGVNRSDILKGHKIQLTSPLLYSEGGIGTMYYSGVSPIKEITNNNNTLTYGHGAIAEFGTLKSGFPMSLNKSLTTASNGKRIQHILSVDAYNYLEHSIDTDINIYRGQANISDSPSETGRYIFAYIDEDGQHRVDMINPNERNYTTNTDGLIIMNPFNGSDKVGQKVLNGISIRTSDGGDINAVVKAYIINSEGNMDYLGEMKQVGNREDRELFLENINFYDITIGFTIQHDETTHDNALKLYSVKYSYEYSGQ